MTDPLRPAPDAFRLMVESIRGCAIFRLDPAGRIASWNAGAVEILGYDAADVLDRPYAMLFTGEAAAADAPQRHLAAALADGAYEDEGARRRKDGTTFRASVSVTSLQEGVEHAGFAAVIRDITESKQAEILLAERQDQLRLYAENSPAAIAMFDRNMTYLVASRRWMEDYNLGNQSIIGRRHYDVFPEIPQRWKDIHQRCLAGAAEQCDEDVFLRADGTVDWIRWDIRPWHRADGRIGGILVFSEDITGRKHAEEARRESDARYRILFDHAGYGILIADPRGYYTDANPAMCRMLGYDREELIALHSSDIVAPEEIPYVDPALAAINAALDYRREWRFRRKDGSMFVGDVVATQMPDGNPIGMIRDVTERKLFEAELEKRLNAEAANRIKSAFLASMSHELRTPLNSIIGFTSIILQGLTGPVNPEQTKQLDVVLNSAQHLLALINDVLDISRIEAGQLSVGRAAFNVPASIDKVTASIRPVAEKKGLSLQVRIAPELGEAVGDERRFEQVLLNLLSNAIKFTERGGVDVLAESVTRFLVPGDREPQAAVQLRITDTGIGIEPGDLGTLFEPFRQLDSGLSRRHEGTGLGLAICRRLTELMGGRIDAESVPDQGSIFIVTIPLNARPEVS